MYRKVIAVFLDVHTRTGLDEGLEGNAHHQLLTVVGL